MIALLVDHGDPYQDVLLFPHRRQVNHRYSRFEAKFDKVATRWIKIEGDNRAATSELVWSLYIAIVATFAHFLASPIYEAVSYEDQNFLHRRYAYSIPGPDDNKDWRNFRLILHWYHDSYSRIDDYFSRHMKTQNEHIMEKVRHLRSMYVSALQAGSRHEQRMRDTIQVDVAALSLDESRAAIQQSREISMLTRLAFVFIPLTFTTGVFGMNVKPFGGEAPMWQFWTTIGCISFGAFCTWGLMTNYYRLQWWAAKVL